MELPVAGISDATLATSTAAADSMASYASALREQVYTAIREAGSDGLTDYELQESLALDGNTERPRRWELWKADRICPMQDAAGTVVKRKNGNGRQCVVWTTVGGE